MFVVTEMFRRFSDRVQSKSEVPRLNPREELKKYYIKYAKRWAPGAAIEAMEDAVELNRLADLTERYPDKANEFRNKAEIVNIRKSRRMKIPEYGRALIDADAVLVIYLDSLLEENGQKSPVTDYWKKRDKIREGIINELSFKIPGEYARETSLYRRK